MKGTFLKAFLLYLFIPSFILFGSESTRINGGNSIRTILCNLNRNSGSKNSFLNIRADFSGTFASANKFTTVSSGYGDYAFSAPITLNSTSLGLTADLTNFPALLKIQDSNLIISNGCNDKVVYPNGPNYDFAFYDPASSAELYYQVDSYDQTTGTLLVWVQIPTLTFAANKVITFYYGSKTPVITHNTSFYQNTWGSDYKAVFHFNEPAYTGTVADGTSGGNTGTATAMTSADLVNGKIGSAYSFNGSTKKIICNPINVTGPFTLSAWVRLSAINLDQKIMTNQVRENDKKGYKVAVYINNFGESETGMAINRGIAPFTPAFAVGVWHYIQAVYTGTLISTYVDGIQYATLNTTINPHSTSNYYIGVGEGGNVFYFNGVIDEPRVCNVAKTTQWINAEYINQNNPAAFTITGATAVNFANEAKVDKGAMFTWTGNVSTDPNVAANWNNTTTGVNAQLPPFDGTANLVIPAGLVNYPKLTANMSLYGLSIAGGALLNLNGFTVNVACNIYNRTGGQILYNNNTSSGLNWNGTSNKQFYNGSANASTAQCGSFTVNNTVGGTVTINGGYVDIYNTLNITKGNLAVSSSPAVLTLKSTPLLSASVSAITSPYTVTGNVNVERSFKAQTNGTTADNTRNYRLLSSPVNMNSIIDNTAANAYFNLNYLNASSGGLTGVFTAGPGGATSGFTVANATPFLYLYKENLNASPNTFNGGNFKGITDISGASTVKVYNDAGSIANIDATLYSGTGYMLYYAGNNTANITSVTALNKQYRVGGSYIAPDASTTTAIGTLNQGNIPVKLWWNSSTTLSNEKNGYNLVGNPYASSIDWDKYNNASSDIAGIGLSSTIYVYNYLNRNYGTYQPGLPNGVGTGNGTHIIASGQGFFVKAISASPGLTFTERSKTNTQPNNVNAGSMGYLLMSVKKAIPKPQILRVKISKDSVNTDDIMILFAPDAKNGYEPDVDADRLSGIGNTVTLASYSTDSNKPLAINHMGSINLNTKVKLYVNVSDSKSADTLAVTGFSGLDSRYDVLLVDHYKRDSLLISKYGKYLFNVNASDTASYGANRFELIFRKKDGLAYKLLNFTGKLFPAGIQLTWTSFNEQTFTDYQLQRLSNTGEFVTLYALKSDGKGTYTYIDDNPYAGANTYRLKQVDVFGEVSYSNPVIVDRSNDKAEKDILFLYPNPASNLIKITITANVPDKVILKITNSMGQSIVFRESAGSNIQQDINHLSPGVYIVQVMDKATQVLIGTKKMYKK